jgi:hypothetical protein
MLSYRWLAWSIAMLACVTTVLVLVNSWSKPFGIRWLSSVDSGTVWGKPDWWDQSVLRPDDRRIFREVETTIPADASIALAPGRNELISPFFGPDLRRHVFLVRAHQAVPDPAAWLVAAPGVRPRLCSAAWQALGGAPKGWLVARRTEAATCSST